MKRARQFTLPLRRSASRRKASAAYRRKDSRYWQVRFVVDGRTIRRTTGALTRAGALAAIPSLRAHYQRSQSLPSQPRFSTEQITLLTP